ncbi:MAG: hypothetical protein ACKV2Q_31835 [Planctomycetaceae bacterium]
MTDRRFTFLRMLLSLSVVMALMTSGVSAADPPVKQQGESDDLVKQESKAATERAVEEIGKWKFQFEDEKLGSIVAEKDSALRWAWTDNGRAYGNLFVLSAQDRPVAIVEFFTWYSPIQGAYFQCTSLTNSPMTAKRSGQEIWRPTKSNVVMKDFPDAPAPAKTATARLVQMRRLAEAFQVEVDDKRATEITARQLRLMSRPVHRYGKSEGTVLDGALFSFAVSSDPGAILVLEVVSTPDGPRWQYGFARVWSYGARASYDGKRIWEIEEVNPRADMKADFYLNALP